MNWAMSAVSHTLSPFACTRPLCSFPLYSLFSELFNVSCIICQQKFYNRAEASRDCAVTLKRFRLHLVPLTYYADLCPAFKMLTQSPKMNATVNAHLLPVVGWGLH